MNDAERKVWSEGVEAIGQRLRRAAALEAPSGMANALLKLAEACDELPLDAADAASRPKITNYPKSTLDHAGWSGEPHPGREF